MVSNTIAKLKENLLKEIDFDYMISIGSRIHKDKIIVYETEGKVKRHYLPIYNEHSLVNIVFKSLQPDIINHIEDSFLYNQKSDNPFAYDISRVAILPCYFEADKDVFGVIILYRKKKLNNFFKKEDITTMQQLVFNYLNLNKKKYKRILRRIQNSNFHNKKINDKKELNQANQFFSSVIHDIRTPMNAVMGFLELLEDDAEEKQKEYIRTAYKSSEMVVALINDVLDINKITMGKLDINYHFFSLLDVMENTALLFYHNAIEKGIDLVIYYDPLIPYLIKSDSFRIKQILNNLLSNAIKFTDKGGMILLEFLYEEKSDKLICSVSDTGIGIPQNAQKNILKPFRQATSATSAQYGGTGLGLSISVHLVKLLGGEFFVKSKEGKGSKFSISIPCNSIEDTGISIDIDEELPMIYLINGDLTRNRHIKYIKKYFERLNLSHKIITQEEALKHTNYKDNIYIAMRLDYSKSVCENITTSFRKRLIILEIDIFTDRMKCPEDITILDMPIFPHKLFDILTMINNGVTKESETIKLENQISNQEKHILIVDDSLINLKLTKEITKKLGFLSTIAQDGQEAVDIFKEKGDIFDVILIDENMPVMNGTEAIKIIRSLTGGDKPYICGLTGDSDEEVNEAMKNAGADDILEKPVKVSEIKEVLYR